MWHLLTLDEIKNVTPSHAFLQPASLHTCAVSSPPPPILTGSHSLQLLNCLPAVKFKFAILYGGHLNGINGKTTTLPNLIVRLSESYYYYCSCVTLRLPPHLGNEKSYCRSAGVKRPDFQGLFSYLRGSQGLSARRA